VAGASRPTLPGLTVPDQVPPCNRVGYFDASVYIRALIEHWRAAHATLGFGDGIAIF
jgi:hypothetical protein